jgi:isopentenyl phosphate kinase
MTTTILKIGGSIITHKGKSKPSVNFKNLKIIARQLAQIRTNFVLIHGAGSFGHIIVKKTGINKGIKTKKDLVSFGETQRLQNELNAAVVKELIKHKIPAFPCQVSSHAVMNNGRLTKMNTRVITNLLKLGMIPVLYGVPAYDLKKGCSILSGDQIASFLAKKMPIKKIIMASDVDGIFTSNPKTDRNAKTIKTVNRKNFSHIKRILGGSTFIDVTGGMLGKVSELIQIAKKGVESQIINGTKPGNIKKAFLGKKIGTTIKW